MRLETEKQIIKEAVEKASATANDRHELARLAAILANKKGVNISKALYLEDIFIEALDEIDS